MYIGDIYPYPVSLYGTLKNTAVPLQQNNICLEMGEDISLDDRYFGEFTDVGIAQLVALRIPVVRIEGTFIRNGKTVRRVYVDDRLLE